jgi:hypothetical protein
LYGIDSTKIESMFERLEELIESDGIEFEIVERDEHISHVYLYHNGLLMNAMSTSVSSTVDEQTNRCVSDEHSSRSTSNNGKRNNDQILSPPSQIIVESVNVKRQKSQSNNIGILTHIDNEQPFVYLQLLPESSSIMTRIEHTIDRIVQNSQCRTSCEINDYVIAQYADDGVYYRARIQSYESTTSTYIYDYAYELNDIEPQAHRYRLEKISTQQWLDHVRTVYETKTQEQITFEFVDDEQTTIRTELSSLESSEPATWTATICGVDRTYFYIHRFPQTDALVCEILELLQTETKQPRANASSWSNNELCIVFDRNEDVFVRGKILVNDNDRYDVQCIDYGRILSDITSDDLYILPDQQACRQAPLARQCRLYNVTDENQIRAIDETIRMIGKEEIITVTLHNSAQESCLSVMLFRENHDIVNDRYQTDHEIKVETTKKKES